MAIRCLPIFTSHLIIFPLLFCSSIILAAKEDEEFVKSLKPSGFFGGRREKLSHFRLYWHDIYSGKRPSAMQIVTPPLVNSTTGFGIVSVIDDPLTLGPSLRSRLVGRAQGFYALASQEEVGLLMTMNFAFLEGKYSGSYITVLGRNPVLNTVREMSVIGGSGIFRLARGYVKAKTYWFNTTSGDAIVEYNVYVLHY